MHLKFVISKIISIFASTVLATLPVEQRTRAGLLLFMEYEVHEITNGSAKSGSSSEGQRIAY